MNKTLQLLLIIMMMILTCGMVICSDHNQLEKDKTHIKTSSSKKAHKIPPSDFKGGIQWKNAQKNTKSKS